MGLTNSDCFLWDQPDECYPFEFDRNAPILHAIRTVLRQFPVSSDTDQFAFYHAETNGFLANSKTFQHYALPEPCTLDFQKAYATYHISIPSFGSLYYQLSSSVLVSELYELLEANLLRTSCLKGAASEYGLFIPGDLEGELFPPAAVSDYSYLLSQTLEYRLRLEPLYIYHSGTQICFQVDYMASLTIVKSIIASAFGLPSFDPAAVTLLKFGDIGSPLSFDTPLLAQGIRPPATLVLSMVRRNRSRTVMLLSSHTNNIYDEPISDATLRLDPDTGRQGAPPVVVAATLNKLVHHLTHERWTDAVFTRMFSLTFPLFTSPKELIAKLAERYATPPGMSLGEATIIKARVLNSIRILIKEHPGPFVEQNCMQLVEDFLIRKVSTDDESFVAVKSTSAKILAMIHQHSSDEHLPAPAHSNLEMQLLPLTPDELSSWTAPALLFETSEK